MIKSISDNCNEFNGIYKFVNHEVPGLEIMKDSTPFKLRIKLNKGGKLNRQEKDYLTEKVRFNSFAYSVAISGWRVEFRDVLKRYIIKQYNSWYEVWAADKTALRRAICGKIDEIVEIAK